MTKEEYKEKKRKLEEEHKAAMRTLDFSYAKENNKVNVGDYVTDHMKTIRVKDCRLTYEYIYPSLVYSGSQCKKNGEPMKNPKEADIYQHNLKYINGEPVV